MIEWIKTEESLPFFSGKREYFVAYFDKDDSDLHPAVAIYLDNKWLIPIFDKLIEINNVVLWAQIPEGFCPLPE
jgi:hypothetical protein